jgi:hypothetical protein
MEHDGSSPYSQKPATCPYPEPQKSNLCPPIAGSHMNENFTARRCAHRMGILTYKNNATPTQTHYIQNTTVLLTSRRLKFNGIHKKQGKPQRCQRGTISQWRTHPSINPLMDLD